MRSLKVLPLVLCCALASPLAGQGPARANDNRTPAGTLRANVLTLRLAAQPVAWHPEAADGPRLAVEAFAEEGKTPTIPGPLIRTVAGRRVMASIRNVLPDTLIVRGLSAGDRSAPDSLSLAPGESAEVAFTPTRAGTYVYWGTTLHAGGITRLRGTGGQLVGAIVVDTAGAPADRVFVISFWDSSPDGRVGERDPFIFVINGKSWPHTERLAYSAGDTVRWRVVNASRDEHPTHLHGFYFRVDARGTGTADTLYPPGQRRLAVTEMLLPMTTMAVAWAPDRPGNWVFHCHNTAHITGDLHHGLAGTPPPMTESWGGVVAVPAGGSMLTTIDLIPGTYVANGVLSSWRNSRNLQRHPDTERA